jgi:hypothetical protein
LLRCTGLSVPMTQILEMRSWKWIRVCLLLGSSLAHGGLANTRKWPVSLEFCSHIDHAVSPPTNATTPTPASNYTASITSSGISASPSSQPTSITSCGSVNFTTYLQSSLQALPSAALEAYFASGYSRLNSDLANIERYANSPITDTIAFESFLYAELSTVSADISSLFGSVGRGVLSFQNIASTDPCLFSTCLTSYLAESSALAPLYSPGVFDFVYKASPPCCGQCIVSASGVELAYWPTPAPTPPVSVLVNANNVS